MKFPGFLHSRRIPFEPMLLISFYLSRQRIRVEMIRTWKLYLLRVLGLIIALEEIVESVSEVGIWGARPAVLRSESSHLNLPHGHVGILLQCHVQALHRGVRRQLWAVEDQPESCGWGRESQGVGAVPGQAQLETVLKRLFKRAAVGAGSSLNSDCDVGYYQYASLFRILASFVVEGHTFSVVGVCHPLEIPKSNINH